MTAYERTSCRACDSNALVSVLDLGEQPLANRLLTEAKLDLPEPQYPLHMVRCLTCGLWQLTHVVDPEVLYRDYKYESGHSAGWHTHCERLAQEIVATRPNARVLDVASNDGTLLRHCRDHGCDVRGVDPARNMDAGDVTVIRDFWSLDAAKLIGQVDVVVAQNVFGHVDDARGFLEAIAFVLAPGGVAIIECPWVVDLLKYRRWDTIYHEHLSYWSLKPLCLLADQVGLEIAASTHLPELHGGTLRYYLRPRGAGREPYVADQLGSWIDDLDCQRFRDSVQIEIAWWEQWFSSVNRKAIAGYGASAKSSTFLNALSARPPLCGIFDDSPTKQGLYTPGWHYPVLKPTKMTLRETDVLINLSPNWPGLETKARELGFAGEVRSLWHQ